MWNFFKILIDSIMSDQGQLDEYLEYVSVVLINFINKAPEQMKQLEYPGQQNQTCLNMLCNLVAKIFKNAQILEDEITAISGVTLVNAILENIKGVSEQILPGLIDLFLQELQDVETKDFECMLLQGIMLALYYDCPYTLQLLEQRNALNHILQKTLEHAQ